MIKSMLRESVSLIWNTSKSWILVSTMFSIIGGLIPLASLYISKTLINGVSDLISKKEGDAGNVVGLLAVQLLLLVFTSILSNLKMYMNKSFSSKLNHDLQYMILDKTSSVSLLYYETNEFYDRLSRVNMGKAHLSSSIQAFFELLETLINMISILVFLFSVNWIVVLVSVLISIPNLIVQIKFGNKRFGLFAELTPLSREVNYLHYLLSDRNVAKEIRVFNLAKLFLQRWSKKYQQNNDKTLHLLRNQQIAEVGLDLISSFFYVSVAGLIIFLARTTSLTIGSFVAIGQAVQGFHGSMSQLSMQFAKLYEDVLYIRDFFEFLEYKKASLELPSVTTKWSEDEQMDILFERVSFQYPGSDRNVLQDVSLYISPGEKIAIVGANGSGKTTLIKCLIGLLPTTSGSITIGNRNIQEIDQSQLWSQITIIFQDFVRYSYSVAENIGLGDSKHIDDLNKIRATCALCGVEDFVKHFSDGYDTYLGKVLRDGADLSGGQWQKIALARALFRESSIIVLDEPTSAIDPQAEMELFQSFDLLTKDKTVIYISHRMAASRLADRIVVMKEGQIVEIGSHAELMSLGGEYYQMFQNQAHWYGIEFEQEAIV